MAWLPFTLILYHISIYMSRALFYFFRLPLSWLSVNRFNYYHFTPNIIHLFKLLVKSFFFPFRLPFKVVGGFGLGLTANPISIIYTNIISYFLMFVKAFNLPFRLPWLSSVCLNSFLILILYHNYFYMSSNKIIGVRLPLGLVHCDIYYIFYTNIIHPLHLKVKR